MNLILFDEPFDRLRLEGGDRRARHLREVLRAEAGSPVFVGFAGGARARAEVTRVEADGAVTLEVRGTEPAPAPLRVSLLVGLPRPHTARRLLFEAASMGVAGLVFFEAERGEPSYGRSRLWRSGEWRERLRLGAEQGFGTHLPEVSRHVDLRAALTAQAGAGARVALDNYEAEGPLGAALALAAAPVALALGPERGWSAGERDALRGAGWRLAHLGAQVLRTETAAVAAVAVAAATLDLWGGPTRTRLAGGADLR